MKCQLLITKADNGFIIHWKDEIEDGFVEHEEVFENKEEKEEDELECMQDLLYRVKEYFGISYSKHKKKNLVIEIEENREEKE